MGFQIRVTRCSHMWNHFEEGNQYRARDIRRKNKLNETEWLSVLSHGNKIHTSEWWMNLMKCGKIAKQTTKYSKIINFVYIRRHNDRSLFQTNLLLFVVFNANYRVQHIKLVCLTIVCSYVCGSFGWLILLFFFTMLCWH